MNSRPVYYSTLNSLSIINSLKMLGCASNWGSLLLATVWYVVIKNIVMYLLGDSSTFLLRNWFTHFSRNACALLGFLFFWYLGTLLHWYLRTLLNRDSCTLLLRNWSAILFGNTLTYFSWCLDWYLFHTNEVLIFFVAN